MLLNVGYTLVDRYRIVALLAKGMEGATYRAWDGRSHREVALKQHVDTSSIKLFRTEAQKLAQIQHPNLAKFIDHFSLDDAGLFLVSEFVEGVSAESLVTQYGSLPQAEIINWLQQVCAGLTHLHELNRLHLDIKPANVRIRPNAQVVLVDSGLPGIGIAGGSSGYASPEQAGQAELSPKSDIYSLGATLYTLLTATEPPDALQRATELQELIPAREVNASVEPYLSITAQHALSLQPDLRQDSAEVFANALGRPADVPPLPPTIRQHNQASTSAAAQPSASQAVYTFPARRYFQQRKRRQMERKTIVALSLILLVLFGAGLAFGYISLNREDAELEQAAVATATTRSQIAVALTEVAPTSTIVPTPTPTPTPTPRPIVDEKAGGRLIFVPGGGFRMGEDEGDDDDRMPLHKVQLKPYFIDETEVTNGMYATCVSAEICAPPQSPNATFHPSYYGDSDYDDYPVIFVTWQQAQQFCEWREGRLPTEAEWEYAAGFDPNSAQRTLFPWGNTMNEANANFCDTNCNSEHRNTEFDDGYRDTAPVKSFPAGKSAVGVYDMAGNVMEWVQDWYDDDYYETSSDTNPLGPADGTARVLRGGSWLSDLDDLEVTSRGSFVPEVARANLGFRCVMTTE